MSGDHEYTGAGNVKFSCGQESGLFDHKPKWCLSAELIETARRYGRTNAKIDPSWIEPLAEHVSSEVIAIRLAPQRGTVMAMEARVAVWDADRCEAASWLRPYRSGGVRTRYFCETDCDTNRWTPSGSSIRSL